MECRYCAEQVSASASKCKHCGESLVESDVPSSGGGLPVVVIVLIAVVALFCLVGIVAAVAIPNLLSARKNGNEVSAIGSLKTIAVANTLYREGDKDGDKVYDYGTLSELGTYNLVDSVLATGTKNGYLFECSYSATTSEFLWVATASPAIPGSTGDRFFITNNEGVTFYSNNPIPIDTVSCTIPPNLRVVGR